MGRESKENTHFAKPTTNQKRKEKLSLLSCPEGKGDLRSTNGKLYKLKSNRTNQKHHPQENHSHYPDESQIYF